MLNQPRLKQKRKPKLKSNHAVPVMIRVCVASKVAHSRNHSRKCYQSLVLPAPLLAQYTVGSLIRHVYGEDCTVLIEQFGLVPTFNRALLKFTEQYISTLSLTTTTERTEPVEKRLLPVMLPHLWLNRLRNRNQRQFYH